MKSPLFYRKGADMLTKHINSVCLVSIARLGPLYVIATNEDVSRHNGPAAILSSMEMNVGIICASLPSLRAITLRTCSRHHQPTSPHCSHSGWSRFGKRKDDIELGDINLGVGVRQDSGTGGSAITKIISVSQERKDPRKLSIWSINGGGIFAGAGVSKAHISSDKP